MIRVGINGYGTIGRRVADAVRLQPDMELVGIAKVRPDYKCQWIADRGYAMYGADAASAEAMRKAGHSVAGTLEDLLGKIDVMIDAVPPQKAKELAPLYDRFDCKVVYQGGEGADIAECSFNAQNNYDVAVGRRRVRVVSCNSTGLCRSIGTLHQAFGVELARVVITRKATDPDDPNSGPVDAVVLDPAPAKLPSHHGGSVATVIPGVRVLSMAARVPTTHAHFHSLMVTLQDKAVTTEDAVRAFRAATRVIPVDSRTGLKSTAQLFDYSRELGRSRSDLYELAVWEDSITVVNGEVFMFAAVHQEAIVIPENIDAIRAVTASADARESIALTNRTLGVLQ